MATEHSVFVTRSGIGAVVVINSDSTQEALATMKRPNPGTLVTATPEQPDAQPSWGQLSIPARSAVVVMEQ